jgi:ribose 5-phosphate isomerase B
MSVIFGCDYNADFQKSALISVLSTLGTVIDVTEQEPGRSDYATVTTLVCERMTADDLGVLVCDTGIGVLVVADRHKGITAARCLTIEEAEDGRVTNKANVLCISSKVPVYVNMAIIRAFFRTLFNDSPKRMYSLQQFEGLERDFLRNRL